METYNKIFHIFSIIETTSLLENQDKWIKIRLHLTMLQIFDIYIVISIIGNILIKIFSLIVLRNRVKQKLYYQRTNYAM